MSIIRGVPGVPNFRVSECDGLPNTPCSTCLPQSYLMSVWLAYQPAFQFLIGTFYGPLPLLIVLYDIHRGIELSRSSQYLMTKEAARNRQTTTFKHFMTPSLFEFYMDPSSLDSHSADSQSLSSEIQLNNSPKSSAAGVAVQ